MNASLSDEQEQIRATAAQLARELGAASPAELPPTGDGAAAWRRLAELGFLGMRVPEAAGGSPASGVEVALVAEQLGARCAPLPFLGSAVWASEWLARAGAAPELLAALASGALRVAPVLDPSLRRWARRGEPGIAWESRGARAGLVLDPDAGRLSLVALGPALESQDLTRELRAVSAEAPSVELGDLGGALAPDALQRALALALASLAADLVGVMQAALDLAVAYLKQREQFGVAIGSFQALQHLAAEAFVSIEGARGCVWYAAWGVEALPPDAALLAARAAKAYASEHAREVCETCIQLHGGIGLTWEAMPQVYLRRALLGRLALGDEAVQVAAIADLRAASAPLAI